MDLIPFPTRLPVLRFTLFGQHVAVACDSRETAELLGTIYGAFPSFDDSGPAPALDYSVEQGPTGEFLIRRRCDELSRAYGTGSLLYEFEHDLTVEVQKRRPDLYFLHAAALEREGRAVLLVAESGGGKSTTAWALLHHGFRYASDELAPIELSTGRVHGFPHALCLKSDPPGPYVLPRTVVRTSRSRHVPVELLPCGLAPCPLPLDAVVFLRYREEQHEPAIRCVGAAEATARLYVQALNPLAHSADGLDAALQVVRGVRCFDLDAAGLGATCDLVVRTLFP
jgi:hypothetical protein